MVELLIIVTSCHIMRSHDITLGHAGTRGVTIFQYVAAYNQYLSLYYLNLTNYCPIVTIVDSNITMDIFYVWIFHGITDSLHIIGITLKENLVQFYFHSGREISH